MSSPDGDCLATNSLPQSQSQIYVTIESVSQSVLMSSPIWDPRPGFYYCQTFAGLLMWGALYGEGMDLSFTIAAGPRQRSHSRVRVPRNSWPYFTASDSRLHQPGGPRPRIYIPQEQGDPVIPPGIGLLFRHLLRFAGLRWRYSNPPQSQSQSQSYFATGGLHQSVRLGAKPVEDHDQKFFLQLNPCGRSPYVTDSELLCDWRFTANQFVLATSPLILTTSKFIFQLNICGYSPYVISSLTRGWVFRLQSHLM
jgi:hypothetical protein